MPGSPKQVVPSDGSVAVQTSKRESPGEPAGSSGSIWSAKEFVSVANAVAELVAS